MSARRLVVVSCVLGLLCTTTVGIALRGDEPTVVLLADQSVRIIFTEPQDDWVLDRDSALEANGPEAAEALARAEQVPVEDTSQREEYVAWFALPEGGWAASVTSGTQFVRTDDGSSDVETWVPIDKRLQVTEGGRLEPTAAKGNLSLPLGGPEDTPAVKFVPDGGGVGITATWNVPLPQGEIDGARVTYGDVLPGIDVIVEALDLGFEIFYVVHSPDAVVGLGELEITYAADTGTVSQAARGFQVIDSSGDVVGSIPEPVMWDARIDSRLANPVLAPWSADPVAASASLEDGAGPAMPVAMTEMSPVDLEVREDSGHIALTMRVPEDFKERPDVTYPLVIDPTYGDVTPYPSFDTWVDNKLANNAYPNSTELILGSWNANEYAESFLSFPLAAFKSYDIMSARFSIWQYWASSCTASYWYVFEAGAANSATTYNNRPGRIGGYWGYSVDARRPSCAVGAGWISADITSLARKWHGSTASSGHIQLYGDAGSYITWKRMYSANSSTPPRIDLKVNRAPAVPTLVKLNGSTVTSGQDIVLTDPSLTLTAKVTDPDANTVQLAVTIKRVAGSSEEIVFERRLSSSVSSGATATMDLSPYIAYGDTYTISVAAWDGRLYSTSGAGPYSFTLSVPPAVDFPTDDDDLGGN